MAKEFVVNETLAAKTAKSYEVARGDLLRITDLEGKQVADMVCFNYHNHNECLSTSNSRNRYDANPGETYLARDGLKEGDTLLSVLLNPIAHIKRESSEVKGVHDALNRMCDNRFYSKFGYPSKSGCFEHLSAALEPYGIKPEQLPDPFNVFMNWKHDCSTGGFTVFEPITKPGDYIEFEFLMDAVVGLSNCPDDVVSDCNGRKCTDLGIRIERPGG